MDACDVLRDRRLRLLEAKTIEQNSLAQMQAAVTVAQTNITNIDSQVVELDLAIAQLEGNS